MLGFVLLIHAAASPVLLCLILIGQIVLCAFVCRAGLSNLWVVLVFTLIFFGGLIVLFVYISGLVQSERIGVNLPLLLGLSPVAAYFIAGYKLEHARWEETSCAGLSLYSSECLP